MGSRVRIFHSQKKNEFFDRRLKLKKKVSSPKKSPKLEVPDELIPDRATERRDTLFYFLQIIAARLGPRWKFVVFSIKSKLPVAVRRSDEGVPRVFQARAQFCNGRGVFTAALTVDVFHTSENKFLRSLTIALLNDNVSLEMITYRYSRSPASSAFDAKPRRV